MARIETSRAGIFVLPFLGYSLLTAVLRELDDDDDLLLVTLERDLDSLLRLLPLVMAVVAVVAVVYESLLWSLPPRRREVRTTSRSRMRSG